MTHGTAAELILSGGVSPFDALMHVDKWGEHWFARELQKPSGYVQWRRFEDSIDRARITITNIEGVSAAQEHIANVGKLLNRGSRGGTQEVKDYRLTRYGAYLTLMNGDPRKPEIAAAQMYFATKTREAEVQHLKVLEAAQPRAAVMSLFESSRGGFSIADAGAMNGLLPMEAHRLMRSWGATYRMLSGGLYPSQLWISKGWMRRRGAHTPVFTAAGLVEVARRLGRKAIA